MVVACGWVWLLKTMDCLVAIDDRLKFARWASANFFNIKVFIRIINLLNIDGKSLMGDKVVPTVYI